MIQHGEGANLGLQVACFLGNDNDEDEGDDIV